jgi:hypothetical protein
VPLAGDADDDLIEVPFVAAATREPLDAVGELPAELEASLPDRVMCHQDATRRQYLFDHPQAQWEPEIQPDRVTDEFREVAVTSEKWAAGLRHPKQISDHRGFAKTESPQLAGARGPTPIAGRANKTVARALTDPTGILAARYAP